MILEMKIVCMLPTYKTNYKQDIRFMKGKTCQKTLQTKKKIKTQI